MDATSKRDRDQAAEAYVECALWTDGDFDWSEDGTLTPEGETRLTVDLFAFLDDPEVAALVATWEPGQVGHDFWLTRNRHGAGFWDRGKPEGDRLTELANAYGEDDLGNYLAFP